jgi:neutral amino acid transport system permease protein
MRAASALVVALLMAVGMVTLAGAAHAAEGPNILTTLKGPDGAALAGVVVTATDSEGTAFSATSGPDGAVVLALPKPGTYVVALDESTLPENVALANPEQVSRSVLVLASDKRILFALTTGDGSDDAGLGGNATSARTSSLATVPQLVVDGLLLGLVIALAAVGMNLIFGTTGLSNFSHGELLTLGAFTAIVLNELGINIIIAAPIAIAISAVLWGWLQNRVLWKPLRRRRTGLIAMMIVTIGLAITIRYTLLLFFGGSPRSYRQFAGQSGLEIGPISITPKSLVLSTLAIIAIAITVLWIQNSRIGKATRAVSDNPALASATGIDVERVISVVWVLGAALAAFGGIYLGLTQDVTWSMGQRLLLVIFAAVTLGGLGTIYGAIVGAIVIGLFIQLSTLVIPTEMKTVSALFLMILILLVRPQGILGRRERVG